MHLWNGFGPLVLVTWTCGVIYSVLTRSMCVWLELQFIRLSFSNFLTMIKVLLLPALVQVFQHVSLRNHIVQC